MSDYYEAVTRLRRDETGEDRYGNPVFQDVEFDLPGALFAPRDIIPAAESGREPVVTVPTLYWDELWPDVIASDRLRVRDIVYEVQSQPAEWLGEGGGLVVKLRESQEGVA